MENAAWTGAPYMDVRDQVEAAMRFHRYDVERLPMEWGTADGPPEVVGEESPGADLWMMGVGFSLTSESGQQEPWEVGVQYAIRIRDARVVYRIVNVAGEYIEDRAYADLESAMRAQESAQYDRYLEMR